MGNRRTRHLAWLALLAVGAMAIGRTGHTATEVGRTTAPGKPYLVIDGNVMGWLGKETRTQTATGVDETISFTASVMSRDFYDGLLIPTINGRATLKNLVVVNTDLSNQPTMVTQISDASARSIVFPPLDAASVAPFTLTVNFGARNARPVEKAAAGVAPREPALTKWFVSGFRVEVDGIDTSRVITVNGITLSVQSLLREGQREGEARVSSSPLVLKMPLTYAAPFQEWFAKSPTAARNGRIRFMNVDMVQRATLATNGLRVTRMSSEAMLATVEMSIASVGFSMP